MAQAILTVDDTYAGWRQLLKTACR